jgi:phytoene/squalene synthetase
LLAHWITNLERDVRRGRWFVAVEDLLRNRIALDESPSDEQRWRSLSAEYVSWARRELSKGWGLCATLGPVQGRGLAFLLRWFAASLSSLEARGYAPLRRPSAGWLRFGACLVTSAATSAVPRWTQAGV